ASPGGRGNARRHRRCARVRPLGPRAAVRGDAGRSRNAGSRDRRDRAGRGSCDVPSRCAREPTGPAGRATGVTFTTPNSATPNSQRTSNLQLPALAVGGWEFVGSWVLRSWELSSFSSQNLKVTPALPRQNLKLPSLISTPVLSR